MPRVAKERTKYHAPKAAAVSLPKSTPDVGDIVSAPVPLAAPAKAAEKDVTQPPKSKRAKRADRHQKWMDKIGAAHTQQKLEQRQRGRQTNPSALIRGMTGMKASLKEVQAELIAQHLLSLTSSNNNNKSTSVRAASAAQLPKSRKARDKAAVKEERRFGQVLLHPAFQANPLATIRQHLANTLPQKKTTE
ncbi:hypothetical protein IWW37_004767 [Coemansia sp. RSA 2050]|nr:hypothetical protein IWW37_004767 [Coemansia sp. RSA 2050]KAJ2733005.1 hypothetical protein IW152_003412 [Coemansia sp. BCRC 34962]